MSNPVTSPRILIVEGEAGIALDLKQRLLGMGYEVTGLAISGEQAVAVARKSHPDLVLMGAHLAGSLTGSQSAEVIGRDLHVPIVFLASELEDTTWRRVKAAHAFGYAHEPFDDRELKTVIEMALYKYAAEEEIHRLNRLYATLSQVNQAVVRLHSREEVLQEVCRVAVEVGGFTMAAIGWLDSNTRRIRPIASFGITQDILESISVAIDDSAEVGPTGTAVREDR